MTEQYTNDVDWFANRSIASSAGFFLPHIRQGVSLLDCGCGPGSITIGFAEAIAPGQVTAIDIDPDMIEQAQAAAKERGVGNVRFQVADMHKLPFPDNSFDAVWTASVMQYIEDPVAVAKEMLRVLKPSGVLGERDRNFEGDIIGNPNPKVRRAFKLYYRLSPHLKYGGYSRTTLIKAGFEKVTSSASYETQTAQWTYQRWAPALEERIAWMGLSDHPSAQALIPALAKWSEDPRSYLCMARCEAVGWKPK
jgi:ubiquinone/menaquinone biosynthesis C-methylase UbiE